MMERSISYLLRQSRSILAIMRLLEIFHHKKVHKITNCEALKTILIRPKKKAFYKIAHCLPITTSLLFDE